MMTFLKAQAVFILGSLADYAATLLLVELLHAPYLLGNLTGNILGAITQFILCRSWVSLPRKEGACLRRS